MKTLYDLIQEGEVSLAPASGEPIYNFQDHPDHKQGVNHKGEKTMQRIYSVFKISESGLIAVCRGIDAFGVPWTETKFTKHLIPYLNGRTTIKHQADHYKPVA